MPGSLLDSCTLKLQIISDMSHVRSCQEEGQLDSRNWHRDMASFTSDEARGVAKLPKELGPNVTGMLGKLQV